MGDIGSSDGGRVLLYAGITGNVYDLAIYVLIYMYISKYIIYMVYLDIFIFEGVCVACLTGATCCCVLSKVI